MANVYSRYFEKVVDGKSVPDTGTAYVVVDQSTAISYALVEVASTGVYKSTVDIPFGSFTLWRGTPPVEQTQFGIFQIMTSVIPGTAISQDGKIYVAALPTGITATKIGNGDVDDTELSKLNGITEVVQTALTDSARKSTTQTINGIWTYATACTPVITDTAAVANTTYAANMAAVEARVDSKVSCDIYECKLTAATTANPTITVLHSLKISDVVKTVTIIHSSTGVYKISTAGCFTYTGSTSYCTCYANTGLISTTAPMTYGFTHQNANDIYMTQYDKDGAATDGLDDVSLIIHVYPSP